MCCWLLQCVADPDLLVPDNLCQGLVVLYLRRKFWISVADWHKSIEGLQLVYKRGSCDSLYRRADFTLVVSEVLKEILMWVPDWTECIEVMRSFVYPDFHTLISWLLVIIMNCMSIETTWCMQGPPTQPFISWLASHTGDGSYSPSYFMLQKPELSANINKPPGPFSPLEWTQTLPLPLSSLLIHNFITE